MVQAFFNFFRPFAWLRYLYDWVLSFAEKPGASRGLFAIAVMEASFFPIPPDILLIALAIGVPSRALWFSALCTLGSSIGAVLGYFLGLKFHDVLGLSIIEFYSAQEQYSKVKFLYEKWDAVAVFVAGFTPIPFKVFTIAAGFFEISFFPFVLASLLSRGARFFLVGGLICWFGPVIQRFIDRYFNILTIVFVILVFGGFLLVKYAI